MCGRFSLSASFQDIQEYFNISEVSAEFRARHNIAPTQPVVVISSHPERVLDTYRWGLIPTWAKDTSIGNRMINARSETIDEKPSFKRPFKNQRCLILADGFYEWKKAGKEKIPIYVRLKSKEPFAFAGLWDRWVSGEGEVINSCTIITCEPNSLMKKFHHRMPVILTKASHDVWLNHESQDLDRLKELLKPYPAELMEAYMVSKEVNSPRNDSPECIVPISDERL
ncbi:MAG TPA: SOS response-associated peptidase [bacterium]|jgi:putative SOS response-associated peptidase YedK